MSDNEWRTAELTVFISYRPADCNQVDQVIDALMDHVGNAYMGPEWPFDVYVVSTLHKEADDAHRAKATTTDGPDAA